MTETERHLRSILKMDNPKDDIYIEIGNEPNKKAQSFDKYEMKIFFVDLTHFSRTAQFLILCTAVFFFYLIYGYLQVINVLVYCTFVEKIQNIFY